MLIRNILPKAFLPFQKIFNSIIKHMKTYLSKNCGKGTLFSKLGSEKENNIVMERFLPGNPVTNKRGPSMNKSK